MLKILHGDIGFNILLQTKSYSLHSARTWETKGNASACVGLRRRLHPPTQAVASAYATACVFTRVRMPASPLLYLCLQMHNR